MAPKLYRNSAADGSRTSRRAPASTTPTDKAMGVAVLDYNGDGWPDMFVGSDRVPAKLYRNDGQGHFVDEGVRAGVALSENGAARANMGVDAADYDRSGRPHLVVGNFLNEMLGLYHNENGKTFVDVAPRSEVGRASLLSVTWAVLLPRLRPRRLSRHLRRQRRHRRIAGDGRARAAQPAAAAAAQSRERHVRKRHARRSAPSINRPIMGAARAYADFDGDGDLDIAMTTLNGPASLFRNDGGNRHNWLRVRAVGTTSNRSGLGAVVRVTSASGTQSQTVHSGSSYASQSELTLTFGLGDDPRVTRLELTWPSGKTQTFGDLAPNRVITVDESRGIVAN